MTSLMLLVIAITHFYSSYSQVHVVANDTWAVREQLIYKALLGRQSFCELINCVPSLNQTHLMVNQFVTGANLPIYTISVKYPLVW